MPTLKRCARCKLDKPTTAFSRNRSRYDGLASECRPCHTLSVTKSRNKKLEAVRAALAETSATLARLSASLAPVRTKKRNTTP